MWKGRSRSRGQATVEMAVILPLLVWLLVGIVDMGRMVHAYLTVEHGAREGVRLGITGASDADIYQRVLTVTPSLDPTQLTVQVAPAGTRLTGSDVTVTVTYSYKVLALMGIIGNNVPLEGSLTARVE